MSSKTAGGAMRHDEAGDSGLPAFAGTERLIAAAALEADGTGTGFCHWTAAIGRLTLSPGLLRIAGLDADGFAGTPAAATALLHPVDVAALRRKLAALEPGANRWRARHRVRRADGNEIEVVAVVSVEADAGRRALRASATCLALDLEAAPSVPAPAGLLEHVTRVVPSVLYVLDLDSRRHVFANRSLREVLGHAPGEEPQDWVNALMHPEDVPRLVAHLEHMRSCADGETVAFEYRLRHADGEWRSFLSRDTVFARGSDGRVARVVGAAIDITESRRAEPRVAASEAVLRQLAETNLVGVGVGDTRGRIAYVNDEMLRMMGYSRADYEAGRVNWAECLDAESSVEQPALVGRLLDDGRVVGYERAFRRPDGGRTPYIGAAALLRPGSDLHVSVALDLTRIRDTEEALRLANERFRTALEASPVVVFNQDRELRYTWIHNPALGYRADDVLGKRDIHLFERAEDAAATEAVKRRVIETGRGERVEVVLHHQGEAHDYDLTVQPLRDAAGAIAGVTCAAVDVTERRRHELRARGSEEQLRRVLDSLFVFVGVMTPDGTLTEANRAPLEAGGLAPEEVIGRKFWDCAWWSYDPEVQRRCREACERATRGEASRFDVVVRMREDSRMTIDFTVTPMRDATGRITHLIPSAVEIDERKRAEAALRESERRFKLLADAMPQLVWTASEDGRVDYYNARRAEYRGAADGDGDRWEPFVHPDDVPATRAAWERAASSGELYEMEHRLQRADGEYAWHLSRGVPVRDAEGRIAKWYGTATDIDARKRAEAALQERTALLQALTENTDDLIWAKDRSGRLTLANAAIARLFPQHAHVVGLTTMELLGDAAQAAIIDANDQRIMAAGRAEMVEERLDAHGAERVFVSSKAPLRDAAGAVVGITGVSCDITARKQLEAERAALLDAERFARAEAERANQLKDEFLATVSHELRTPLNAMLGWTQVLARRQQDPALMREGLAVIERNARAQAQLIEDLLDMSRIISGKLRLDVRTVDLHDVISRALETIRPVADARSIRIGATLDARVGAIRGDPDRLQQVVWNLLSNAVKFTPRGGWVEVRLVRRADDVELRVQDSGQGIAPELLPHVFDRFRQGDGSSSRRQGGLGLGLSIVRQLVELHGGTVSAVSPGIACGATFVVELPLGEPDVHPHFSPLAAQAADAVGALSTLRGVVALVVEDEPDSLRMLTRVLEDAGVKVFAAHSAEEALATLARERPDVLLSDIGMPGVDGYELIRQVRSLSAPHGQVPALAITAYARAEDRERALAAGYQAHLAKPVRAQGLLALIESLLH